jgi:hypothetical protein
MNGDWLNPDDAGETADYNADNGSEDDGGMLSASGLGFPTNGSNVVNYFFPVEVVVVGAMPRNERESIQADLLDALNDAIIRRIA